MVSTLSWYSRHFTRAVSACFSVRTPLLRRSSRAAGLPAAPDCQTGQKVRYVSQLDRKQTGLSGSFGTRPIVWRQYMAALALAFFLSFTATLPMYSVPFTFT